LQWDSVTGQDVTPQRLDKLPAWAKAPDQAGELAKMKRAKLEKFRKAALAAGSADAAIKEFIDSDDAYERRLGVYAAAALDRLDYVAEVLHRSKHADTWHNAVVALRHWLGRGPGQDRILYDRLVKLRNYKPAQARTVLQLLHGFSEEQTGRPELYQVLIDMLRHDRLAIRGLANWHLQRLAPTVKIAFDPAGDKQERERAYKEWKRAIPTGKLPPEPAPEKKS
jgi:hypothetical protein